MLFTERARDARDIGPRLGVDYVVDGSVLRVGDALRIDVQLVRVRDGVPIWTGHFDRPIGDLFDVEDEIALAIVNELRCISGAGSAPDRGLRSAGNGGRARRSVACRGTGVPARDRDGSAGFRTRAEFAMWLLAVLGRSSEAIEQARRAEDRTIEALEQMAARNAPPVPVLAGTVVAARRRSASACFAKEDRPAGLASTEPTLEARDPFALTGSA